MNGGRTLKSWVLLGALGLAGATALAVFMLARAPTTLPPTKTEIAKPAPRDLPDHAARPPDSDRVPDLGRASGTETPGASTTTPDSNERAIRGEVHASSGQPIAGAEIRLSIVEPGDTRELELAKCDATGHFRAPANEVDELDPLRRGLAQLVAIARAPGFQSQKQEINLRLLAFEGAAPLYFKFTLTPGNTLTGRIVDSALQPVSGAEVELLVPGEAADGAPHKPGARTGRNVASRDRTRGDGRFALNFVSSGTYQLAARETDTGTAFQEKLDLVAGEDRVLQDVVLHGAGVLAGTTRYPGGAPARSVELWAIPEWMAGQPNELATATLKAADLERDDGLLYGKTVSDSEGHFRFAGLKPANYAIRSPRNDMVLEPRQARYILGSESLTIEVQTYRLLVHVKDASGRPLVGAGVACAEMSSEQDGHLETVKVDHSRATGADATASFEIDSDRTYAVTASSPGTLTAEDLVIVAPGEYELRRELVLQPGGTSGSLHLTLEGAGKESVSRLVIAFVSALTEQRVEVIGTVSPDADGWIKPLPPGRYRLQVGFGAEDSTPSMYFPIATRDIVEIRSGATTEHVVRARPGARVRLTLDVDAAARSTLASRPDSNGNAAGAPQQRARDLREHGAAVTVASGPAGLDRPVQFVEPAPEHPKHFLLASQILPGESALIADLLEPGECTLHVEAPGFQKAEAHASLRPGVIEEVRITLVRK